jgi:hypothetical protein
MVHTFPPDNLVSKFLDGKDLNDDDDDETMSHFYDNLLARASKNAVRPSNNRENDETLFDDLLRRQIRTDDYPIWKIQCKVRQKKKNKTNIYYNSTPLLDWLRRNGRLLIVTRRRKSPITFSFHSRFHSRFYLSGMQNEQRSS